MVDQKQFTPSLIPFWLSAWLGTMLAGGVYGLLIGGCAGIILGCFVAALVGALMHLLAAILTWCFWLPRFRVIVVAMAGAATGVLSGLPAEGFFDFSVPTAGLLGAIGGGVGGGLHWLWAKAEVRNSEHPKNEQWQFTMREMFVHVTVLSILLALVSCLVVAVKMGRDAGRQATCENNLRLLAMSLQNYQASYDSLPPTTLVDENDNPVLSWRVPTMQYVYYDDDFSARLDFSKPWNDPANAPFLDSLWLENLRCPSIERDSTANTTHYVAVTGPGTYWTESASIDVDAHQDAILVVEWPPSDIHWAEPRDVTADEFLAWFESPDRQPRRVHRRGLHYIDARGEVCTLPWSIELKQLRTLLTPLANEHRP